jgi:acetyl esterase/lipase
MLCLLFAATTGDAFAAPSPPRQPAHGPGGADYAHARVDARQGHAGAARWWLYTPADPPPAHAPVVVFCHGWAALAPDGYRAWIDHLVRRGNIVIWPEYQDSLLTPGRAFLPKAIAAVRGAFAALAREHAGVRPELDRVAVAGHSAGGLLAVQLAARAHAEHLPPLRVAFAVEPGDGRREGRGHATIPALDLASLPPATRLAIVVGADDHRAGEALGLELYDAASMLPAANREVIELRSDDHGAPALIANHLAPTAGKPPRLLRAWSAEFAHAGDVDALDWYGTWKLLDALLASTFSDRDRAGAPGGDAAQLDMGRWSDGVPVRPLRKLR